MARLRLVSWQEPAQQLEDTGRFLNVRALSPSKAIAHAEGKKAFSHKALLLAALAHIAVFGILLAAPVNEKVEKEPSAPMLVSLIAAPQPVPEPVVEPEITPPPPEPQPKPIVKQQKPKPQIKPVAKPAPESQPQTIEEPAPSVTEQQPPVQEAAAPQPVAAVSEAEEVKLEPQPEPEPVIEPPRFGVAYLNNPPPAYPALSRRMGEEGRVLLRVLVATNGKPETVEVENGSGSKRLDSAALDAVKKWQFIPAKRNNEPVSAYVLVPVKFSLDS